MSSGTPDPTYSVAHSSSSEANQFSPSQEITHILWDPEGSLPHLQVCAACPYLSQINPVHTPPPHPPSHFLMIHRNIILPSKPGSSKWSLSLRFPHQNPVYTSPLPHMCYIPRPSHSSRFDNPNNIW